jgi:hypothetical protein
VSQGKVEGSLPVVVVAGGALELEIIGICVSLKNEGAGRDSGREVRSKMAGKRQE